jgi:glycerophosphoryl diester phosphodiesterase
MLVFSHRGVTSRAPENTIAAFRAAVELGVDGIETDVRRSRDGELVIYHDRRAPDGRRIEELSLRELRDSSGRDVPTLERILDELPGVHWNIELKTPDAAEAALEILAHRSSTTRIFVTSFRHDVIRRYLDLSELRCGILVDHHPVRAEDLLAGFRSARRLPELVVWYFEFLDAAIVRETRALGLASFAYAVTNRADHDAAVALGLDGVITDHPALGFAARTV